MGKGDKSTRRGKIAAASYGNARRRKSAVSAPAAAPAAKPAAKVARKKA